MVLFFLYKKWGKLVDRIGNKPVMAIAIILGGLNPMFFAFSEASWFWIVYIEAIGSATMWSAAVIVTSNFVLSVAPKQEKAMYIAVLALVSGSIGFVTAASAGYICDFIPTWETPFINFTNMHIIIFVGGLLRWSAIFFLPQINEKSAMPLKRIIPFLINKLKSLIVRRKKENFN